MKSAIATLVLLASFNASADYRKLAECTGTTDRGFGAYVALFVNPKADTNGLVFVSIDRQPMRISDTRINWADNPQGYPRFYDNDYDLNIVINDRSVSTDDILVGDDYVRQLNCRYTP